MSVWNKLFIERQGALARKAIHCFLEEISLRIYLPLAWKLFGGGVGLERDWALTWKGDDL